ncbi:MAG: CPBP family intramembrane glutamic endopeptidase [Mycobacterium sp.]
MARSTDRLRALALAAGLVAWSATAGLDIPGRRQALVQAGLGTALAFGGGARAGVRKPHLAAGVGLGTATAGLVMAVVTVGTAIPSVRHGMRQRELPASAWKWLSFDIPVGTVWAEETAYRGALATVAAKGFGPRRGRLLQASAFGLSHIVDARAAGESMAGTVLVTGIAGWLFAVLAERSGSLIAPALAHLAINESGAVAALLLQRRKANLQ